MALLFNPLTQFAHVAIATPMTIIGLVPIFAAGLTFLRYINYDPEAHPKDAPRVSTHKKTLFLNGTNGKLMVPYVLDIPTI